MTNYETGDRVGALLSINNGKAKLLGYGVYDGDQPCPHLFDLPNPKITLDSGKVVWGCECWWGPEEQIKTKLSKCNEIENVDIDIVRKQPDE